MRLELADAVGAPRGVRPHRLRDHLLAARCTSRQASSSPCLSSRAGGLPALEVDLEVARRKASVGKLQVQHVLPVDAGASEVLHEIDIPDWERAEDSIVFAGPNASVHAGRFFATATCLFQLTNIAGEPDVQTRLIFGFSF